MEKEYKVVEVIKYLVIDQDSYICDEFDTEFEADHYVAYCEDIDKEQD